MERNEEIPEIERVREFFSNIAERTSHDYETGANGSMVTAWFVERLGVLYGYATRNYKDEDKDEEKHFIGHVDSREMAELLPEQRYEYGLEFLQEIQSKDAIENLCQLMGVDQGLVEPKDGDEDEDPNPPSPRKSTRPPGINPKRRDAITRTWEEAQRIRSIKESQAECFGLSLTEIANLQIWRMGEPLIAGNEAILLSPTEANIEGTSYAIRRTSDEGPWQLAEIQYEVRVGYEYRYGDNYEWLLGQSWQPTDEIEIRNLMGMIRV